MFRMKSCLSPPLSTSILFGLYTTHLPYSGICTVYKQHTFHTAVSALYIHNTPSIQRYLHCLNTTHLPYSGICTVYTQHTFHTAVSALYKHNTPSIQRYLHHGHAGQLINTLPRGQWPNFVLCQQPLQV